MVAQHDVQLHGTLPKGLELPDDFTHDGRRHKYPADLSDQLSAHPVRRQSDESHEMAPDALVHGIGWLPWKRQSEHPCRRLRQSDDNALIFCDERHGAIVRLGISVFVFARAMLFL